jgi:uncharacterized protein YbjT (DUF2867 family)
VIVTGATGNVGRNVVDLLARAGVPVRAAGATRQTVEKRFGGQVALSAHGIEPVALDFTDPRTWTAAYRGADRMFLMRPPHLGKPRTQMIPSLEAARACGVKHVVFLSLQGAERNKVVPHARLEAWLRGSGMTWTFVRPSFFMTNLTTTHVSDIRDRDQIVVAAGDGATAFVDTLDVAAVAVAALRDPDAHSGRAWMPTGPEALTYREVAAILSDVLGRSISYTRPGVISWSRHARNVLGLPWGMVAVTTGIYATARIGWAAGLSDDVRTVTGRLPISLRQFAEREQDAWRR